MKIYAYEVRQDEMGYFKEDKWYDLGIRYVSSRTIGLNHIDLEHAREIGIQVCNAKYPPNGVAEFALMLLLMCMRNYKQALWRGQVNDYSLSGLQGKEVHDLTVGVMGTGNIGRTFVQLLSGFVCRILAYDLHENEDVKVIGLYGKFAYIIKNKEIGWIESGYLEKI